MANVTTGPLFCVLHREHFVDGSAHYAIAVSAGSRARPCKWAVPKSRAIKLSTTKLRGDCVWCILNGLQNNWEIVWEWASGRVERTLSCAKPTLCPLICDKSVLRHIFIKKREFAILRKAKIRWIKKPFNNLDDVASFDRTPATVYWIFGFTVAAVHRSRRRSHHF